MLLAACALLSTTFSHVLADIVNTQDSDTHMFIGILTVCTVLPTDDCCCSPR